MSVTKAELRRDLLLRRDELEPAWRAEASERIMERVLGLPQVAAAQRIAAFAGFGSEVDTRALIEELMARGTEIALPRVLGKGAMEFRVIQHYEADCIAGPWGIREPAPQLCPHVVAFEDFDLWLVPLVAFDAEGHRLGYGGGFYDRALSEIPLRRTLGLAFAAQGVVALPREAWDRPLGGICTEMELLRTGGE